MLSLSIPITMLSRIIDICCYKSPFHPCGHSIFKTIEPVLHMELQMKHAGSRVGCSSGSSYCILASYPSDKSQIPQLVNHTEAEVQLVELLSFLVSTVSYHSIGERGQCHFYISQHSPICHNIKTIDG